MQQQWGQPMFMGYMPMQATPQQWGQPMAVGFVPVQMEPWQAMPQQWGQPIPMAQPMLAGFASVPGQMAPVNGMYGVAGPEDDAGVRKGGRRKGDQKGKGGRKGKSSGKGKQEEAPKPGVSITRCSAGDFTRLQDLWACREGRGEVLAAWKVDNPLLVYEFKQRRDQLKYTLGREADALEGFHGSHPSNILSICEGGFDKGRRSGQVYGAGEYFANDPTVSINYSRGGEYMLVCRLILGVESSDMDNANGDHIWVPEKGYYVVREPTQILPQFIIKFDKNICIDMCHEVVVCPNLERVLACDYTTKKADDIVPVRQQRPCVMVREAASVLWIGFLHAHLSDTRLHQDVTAFLQQHASEYLKLAKIQIVKGFYKKAHVILHTPMPRALVHHLNSAPFFEDGEERTVCVEDAHGSPGQKCPRTIAGYCRGQNLRYTHPCFCDHGHRRTAYARVSLEPIDLDGAKGAEICGRFMSSAPFCDGNPKIVGINAIKNDALSDLHEEYRHYLRTKHPEEPVAQELYHGTNNLILDVLYQHGLQPPSDTQASESCPVSGGKGLCTTLCDNTCSHCTKRHEWDKCHMFGLGIYLADMAQKSHRYVSHPQCTLGRQTYRMILCSVLGKAFQIEGHLLERDAMHDIVNVRALDEEALDEMIEPCRTCGTSAVSADNREGSAEKSDLLLVKGLGGRSRPGFSVVNSEFIAFHPAQCLPKYEIVYKLEP